MTITTAITETFTPVDAAALNGYEKVIEHGIDAFASAGRAMIAISDQRLYRQTHDTFADYCSDRWGMSDRHVRRLMLAADVVTKMTELIYGRVSLIWPHCDGLIWPHLRHAGAVL